MNLQLSPNSKKVLIVDNTLIPRIAQVGSLAQKEWPNAKVLFLVKKIAKIKKIRKQRFHLYARKSPISTFEGFKLALRLRKLRPDIILIRKHDLNLKFFLLILMCRPSKVYLWKIHTDAELSLSKINRRSFLIRPYNKRGFLISLLCSSLPLLFLIISLPILWLKNYSRSQKKQFWAMLKSNLQQGPLGDSPWLWAWLQFVMLWVFVFGKDLNFKHPSRILVIRNDHIGDSINTVPLIRHLRKLYQNAKITIMCDTGSFLWENCPYIDEVLLYKTNNPSLNRGRKRLTYALRPFTFMPELRKRKFDLVIDPVGRTETHLISYLCPGAHRISSTYYPYQLFDTTLVIRHYETQLHETRRSLALVKPLDKINQADCQLEFWFKPETRNKAQKILAANHIEGDNMLLGIHPGAISPLRYWPIERMATVAHSLARKYGMDIVFFEPPDNKKMTSTFTTHLAGLGAKIVVISGIDLNLLTALIAECNLFICCDSGPMHLAATTKSPMVAIFGPGEYWRWQPLHPKSILVRKPISCSPCSQNNCKEPQCILGVQISDVLRAAESLLGKCLLNCPAS